MKEFLIDEHFEEIKLLEEELGKLIDYDEWSAREYGVERVDCWQTAVNILRAGYSKHKDIIDKVYMICYSNEESTYTEQTAFATRELAEAECLRFIEEDGLNWYVVEVPLVYS